MEANSRTKWQLPFSVSEQEFADLALNQNHFAKIKNFLWSFTKCWKIDGFLTPDCRTFRNLDNWLTDRLHFFPGTPGDSEQGTSPVFLGDLSTSSTEQKLAFLILILEVFCKDSSKSPKGSLSPGFRFSYSVVCAVAGWAVWSSRLLGTDWLGVELSLLLVVDILRTITKFCHEKSLFAEKSLVAEFCNLIWVTNMLHLNISHP